MLRPRDNIFTPAIGELSLLDQSHLFYYLQQHPTTDKQMKSGKYSYTKKEQTHQFELKHDVILLGTLDFSAANLSHEMIWKHLLHKNYCGRYFEYGTHVITQRDRYNHVTGYMQFRTRVSLGIRKTSAEDIVCDLVDRRKFIADGGYSRVVEITGTVKHRYDENTGVRLEAGKKKRIAKIGQFEPSSNMKLETELNKEFKLAQQCPHLGIRAPMFGLTYPNEKHGFLSMRRMKGEDLYYVVEGDMKKKVVLTTDDRFQLCIAILTALKNQLKTNEITHRDIKTENIMVDQANNWAANFIDLNLSKLRNSKDKKTYGSGHYLAPETLQQDSGDHSDLFSTALVLALIWRDKNQYELTQKFCPKGSDKIDHCKVHKEIIEMRKKAGWKITFDMFDDMKDLSEATKSAIQEQLTKMTDVSQFNRGTVESAIIVFEKLYLSYKYDKPDVVKTEKDAAHTGHQAAVSVRTKLWGYTGFTVAESKTLTKSFDIWLCMQVPPSDQPVLPDHPAAIREFDFALGVPEFRGLTTRQAIIDKAYQIVDDFYAMHHQLIALHKKLKTTHADMLTLDSVIISAQYALFSQCVNLDGFCSRMKNTTLDFSLIAEATRHMQEKFVKVNAACDYFEGLVGFWERPGPCSGLGIL